MAMRASRAARLGGGMLLGVAAAAGIAYVVAGVAGIPWLGMLVGQWILPVLVVAFVSWVVVVALTRRDRSVTRAEVRSAGETVNALHLGRPAATPPEAAAEFSARPPEEPSPEA
jgi:hypothetical protein